MLESIYSRPYRVYICFLLLIIAGIFCYYSMPVALFPNSTKPEINIWIKYDNFTQDSFLKTYGKSIESSLKRLHYPGCNVEKVAAYYEVDGVRMEVITSWGDDAMVCLKEIEQSLVYYKSQWPDSMRHGSHVWLNSKNTGFFLGSFYSERHNAEEIHEILDNVISHKIAALKEVDFNILYNPSNTQVTITLDPVKMAALKLLPDTVITAIREAVQAYNGGILHNDGKTILIEVAPFADEVDHFKEIIVPTVKGQTVVLSAIADISLKVNATDTQMYTLNGEPAIILFVRPLAGQNLKLMCDKVREIVHEALQLKNVPADIKFGVLVNPGDLIKDAIANVMHEVWLCSLIAVIVLFVFIGSISGTFTALLEIPISIILSFILMKLTNVQLNLISLGGLALSVGMNVDASVVVIDSIMKKLLTTNKQLTKPAFTTLVATAVREVFTPVILATITSLIVFVPLVFTSQLTYAILGDLAKTVIYSHTIALFIALILVPTIRIHLATIIGIATEQHSIRQLNTWLDKVYTLYTTSLHIFLVRPKLRYLSYIGLIFVMLVVFSLIPGRLTREIMSVPNTNIIWTNINSFDGSHVSEMAETVAQFERLVQDKFGNDIAMMYAQTNNATNASSAIILKNKRQCNKVLSGIQELTKGSSQIIYDHMLWNPSELSIPNPPDWKIEFIGNDLPEVNKVRDYFKLALQEANIVENINLNSAEHGTYLVQPKHELLHKMQSIEQPVTAKDLSTILALTNRPIEVARFTLQDKEKQIVVMYPETSFIENSAITGLPIPVGDKIVPLRALVEFNRIDAIRNLTRIDGENSFTLEGYWSEYEKKQNNHLLVLLKNFTQNFTNHTLPTISNQVTINMVDAKIELIQAMHELTFTILLSLVLIFLVLYIRFASIVHTLIIMIAIPFGILGVFLSMWLFNSTLSLNSALGIILLNGITVANSIMLVDKILKNIDQGLEPLKAVLLTAKTRIRPILMTSVITILGMLPIALGFGEGGRVLQPLGIAVSGGLWVSLIFTLYVIPALEYKFLMKR